MKTPQPPHSIGPLRCSGNPSSLIPKKRLLDAIARKTKFMRREAKKLTPRRFLCAVLCSVSEGDPALRATAIQAGLQNNDTIAKQSLWERISTPEAVTFFKACVKEAFKINLKSLCPIDPLKGITRILIGDSSAIKLHRDLHKVFPGGSNQNKQSAQLRLQCTLDLLSGQWVDGGFERYLRQDAKAARDLAQSAVLRQGDLVIRDLGYAVIDVFAGIARKGAFFLSRLHPQWNIYLEDGNGDKIDLVEMLEKKAAVEGSCFQMKTRIGRRQQLPCELIVMRVPEAVAATRRRRARDTARRKGVTHSKRYMALQNWTLLVTNVEEPNASIQQLCELYRLRWRVEMFFKLCKSHTALEKIARHRTNPYHAEVLLWAWLFLMVGLSSQSVFAMAEVDVLRRDRIGAAFPPIRILNRSLFKMMPQVLRYVSQSIQAVSMTNTTSLIERLITQSEYHNGYDTRNDRLSLPQRLQSVLASTA